MSATEKDRLRKEFFQPLNPPSGEDLWTRLIQQKIPDSQKLAFQQLVRELIEQRKAVHNAPICLGVSVRSFGEPPSRLIETTARLVTIVSLVMLAKIWTSLESVHSNARYGEQIPGSSPGLEDLERAEVAIGGR
ncbi:hypothetical protein ANCDUO_15509 [Ancylostoma duodenale]|uniref:Uncharacterized protein n=1 Tax=Ancylostoma duodenale TaxID=51022 RepID=A0A0C2GBM6_9BILA|nr:hypothetical protein ANCDUO_15509 [Ancylostoma duodenale]